MVRTGLWAALLACAFVLGIGGEGATALAAQAARASAAAPAPLNLNAATTAELEKLPGVGAAMAARILEYRRKSGGFKKIEDLMDILQLARSSGVFRAHRQDRTVPAGRQVQLECSADFTASLWWWAHH